MKRLSVLAALLLLSCYRNHPPDPPEITGRSGSALPDSTSTFHIRVSDPDGDSVSVRMSWDDGDTSDWSAWIASGQTATFSHVWADTGTYLISAIARDERDELSEWSEPWNCLIALGEFPYRLIKTVECSGEPMMGAAVSPDGKYVYAGRHWSSAVHVIRTSDDSLIRVIPLLHPGWSNTMDIVASPDGNRIYTSWYRGHDIVAVIRTSGFTVEDSIVLRGELSGMAITPDGRRLFATSTDLDTPSIFVVSTQTLEAVDTIHLSEELRTDWCTIAVSPDGRHLYALVLERGLLAFSTETMRMVDSLEFGAYLGLVPDPAGKYIYADCWDQVLVVAAEDLELEGTIDLPRRGTFTATSPDGEYLFGVTYAGGDSSFFDVLSLPAHNIVQSTPLPGVDDLAEVVLLPSGDKAYVVGDGRVHVLSR